MDNYKATLDSETVTMINMALKDKIQVYRDEQEKKPDQFWLEGIEQMERALIQIQDRELIE